jgi:hypothetical protein
VDRAARRRAGDEGGSAVVDFVLIGGLLTVIFFAVIQLTLVLHVRNTLIDAASSGARYGTLADRSPGDARFRTDSLISTALGEGFDREVSAGLSEAGDVSSVEVVVRAPLPLIGLIGPAGVLEVTGHAVLPS